MNQTASRNEQTSMTKPLSAEASIEHQTISRDELRAGLRDRSLIVIDVLPKEAYAEAHIPGAVSLPVAEIEAKARQVIPNLTQAIVVYCGGPTRPLGEQAVGLLKKRGYANVRHYVGGLADWKESGGS